MKYDLVLICLFFGATGWIGGHLFGRWFVKRFLSDNGSASSDSSSADRRDTF